MAFTSPYSGVGTSHTVRQMGLLAARYYAPHGFRVLLVDYDIAQQAQSAYFSEEVSQSQHGALSGPFDMTYGQEPFWQVSPDVVDATGNRIGAGAYAGAYLVGDSGLVISKFDWSKIKSGQNVHVAERQSYWDELRNNFALILVDTPAFDRGDTAMDLCKLSDKTVLVSDAPRSQDIALVDTSQRIVSEGGTCAGLIINSGPISETLDHPPASAPIAS